MENTDNLFSAAWINCGDDSECLINGSSKFEGTVYGRASLNIHDAWRIFVEVVIPVGAKIDESFPSKIVVMNSPTIKSLGYHFILKLKMQIMLVGGFHFLIQVAMRLLEIQRP